MGRLAGQTLAAAVRPPFRWVGGALVEAGSAARRSMWPLLISHAVYLVGFGILLFGLVLTKLGLVDREAGVVCVIWTREISTWVTGMIFAGVVGAANTADLGARKIREELDALDVLGVPQIPSLILPRVLGLTIAAPLLSLLSLLVMNSLNFMLAPGSLGFSRSVFVDSLVNNLHTEDILFTVILKMLVLGFFVGVVSCYKGLACRQGAEGVGRAVNETVVITFFGIWLFNSFFNLAYFALFPDVAVFRG